MAEKTVLGLMQANNKPANLQSLVDLLQHTGLKKPAIQKALDVLAEQGKITAKDFGKTKIYIPSQSDLPVMSKEELEAKQARIKAMGVQVQQEQAEVKALEQQLLGWKSSMTEPQLAAAIKQSREQLLEKQTRLGQLKSGAVLVSKAERDKAVKWLTAGLESWRKRKAMFRNIWSTMSENMERPSAEVYEEMGVETDESAGADLHKTELMLAPARSATAAGGGAKRPRAVLGEAAGNLMR